VSLLVRAIVRSEDALRAATSDLVVVQADGIAALATPCADKPPLTEAELRSHDAITRRIHDGAASLPSRFGQIFADEAALVRALRDRESALAESLRSVGPRVELHVTLDWRRPHEAPAAADASTGRGYLKALAARERERREAEQVVARLTEQLPTERAFIRTVICPRDGVAAIVAILSTRDEVISVRQAVESFGERSSEITALVRGPLPPYTFAS
jgi:hypothetical protein